jgi:hypothetical protein
MELDGVEWRLKLEELVFNTQVARGEFGTVWSGRFYGAKVDLFYVIFIFIFVC